MPSTTEVTGRTGIPTFDPFGKRRLIHLTASSQAAGLGSTVTLVVNSRLVVSLQPVNRLSRRCSTAFISGLDAGRKLWVKGEDQRFPVTLELHSKCADSLSCCGVYFLYCFAISVVKEYATQFSLIINIYM